MSDPEIVSTETTRYKRFGRLLWVFYRRLFTSSTDEKRHMLFPRQTSNQPESGISGICYNWTDAVFLGSQIHCRNSVITLLIFLSLLFGFLPELAKHKIKLIVAHVKIVMYMPRGTNKRWLSSFPVSGYDINVPSCWSWFHFLGMLRKPWKFNFCCFQVLCLLVSNPGTS